MDGAVPNVSQLSRQLCLSQGTLSTVEHGRSQGSQSVTWIRKWNRFTSHSDTEVSDGLEM